MAALAARVVWLAAVVFPPWRSHPTKDSAIATKALPWRVLNIFAWLPDQFSETHPETLSMHGTRIRALGRSLSLDEQGATAPTCSRTFRQMNGEGGLAAVFLTVRPALARFLLARGADRAEAEDLLHELYLKSGEPVAGPVAEPSAYLYRMANNLFLDRRRSSVRRRKREEEWTGVQSGPRLEIDDRPSAEDVLIARERLNLVTDALACLPERTVEIFRRFRVGGEAQKAIAADLAISVSAVEKHLQRAYHVVLEARTLLDADATASRRHSSERESHDA